MTYEYLRRTRQPGEHFAAKDVALQAHAGDWHVAMKSYADWCHRVWKYRPYPSRLGPVLNMIAVGWGKSPLFQNGQYPKHRKRFWNAVGSFGAYYPANFDTILREYDDAFSSRDCEPLVPTLARGVYGNRFSASEKTIYTLYNATGHTFYGPVLRLDTKRGEHVVELLHGKPLDGNDVSLYLERENVACLIKLPSRIKVQRTENTVDVAGCETR